MNPMIRKELRQRMRERQGWILPSLYLVVLGAVIAITYYEATTSQSGEVQGWQVGVSLFIAATFAQLILLLLLAPIFSAASLTIEKEQRTLAGLLTSLLPPAQIWWGKFVASLLFVLLMLIAGLPVISAAFAFGGVGPWEVFIATLTTVVILGTVSAISLFWSSVFRRSVHATAVSYVTVIVLSIVTFIVFLVGMSRHESLEWVKLPIAVKGPLFFNPVFFLMMAFAPKEHLYPEWVACLIIYFSLGILSAFLAVRNLSRSGDAV
jgi:ABC-2 type transport system permease protein